MGGRFDTIQATVLNMKLKHYPEDLKLRQEAAQKYYDALKGIQITPTIMTDATAVHYLMPLHLQECFKYFGYKNGDFPISELISNEIMSLPMNPYLSDDEIEFIVESL